MAKAKTKTKPKPKKHPGGRPTRYSPTYHPKLIEALAESGKTDEDIAKRIGIAASTLYKWLKEKPEFSESRKRGKDKPDDEVEAALLRKAKGYTLHLKKEVSVSLGQGQGAELEEATFDHHVAPDTVAGIFWLKNRRPERWRDKIDHEITGKDGTPLVLEMTISERQARIAELNEKRDAD
ncbi:MAG: transposase [Gammaproteobacteria bacterium]|nr:transposase [Gammaproteobacteria bacterium]